MNLFAGTSGFAFKEWKGSFYPEKMKDQDMLAFYASRFAAVEINNTFYRLPKEQVLLEWAERAPPPFMFAIKASQRITHYARLKPECAAPLEFLLRTCNVLGDRLGPILFQLPPNLKREFDRLRAFLDLLPAHQRFAIEFRHESWFDDDVFDALRARDVALCVSEQPEFASPVVTTANWGYVRLHRLDYDEAALQRWADRLRVLGWNDAYVFFKHDEGIGSGPPAVDAFVRQFRRADS